VFEDIIEEFVQLVARLRMHKNRAAILAESSSPLQKYDKGMADAFDLAAEWLESATAHLKEQVSASSR